MISTLRSFCGFAVALAGEAFSMSATSSAVGGLSSFGAAGVVIANTAAIKVDMRYLFMIVIFL
jgi:hypothetical protein